MGINEIGPGLSQQRNAINFTIFHSFLIFFEEVPIISETMSFPCVLFIL